MHFMSSVLHILSPLDRPLDREGKQEQKERIYGIEDMSFLTLIR